MTLQVLRADQYATTKLARWAWYGPNSVGKTSLLATIPPELRLWVITAVGENMDPLRNRPNTLITPLQSWDQLDEVFAVAKDPKSAINVIAFDTVSRLLDVALEKVSGIKRDPLKAAQYLTVTPNSKRDWDVWRAVGWLGKELVLNFDQLPIHTVYLYQEETYHPKFDDDILVTTPRLVGNIAWATIKDIHKLVGRLYVAEDAGMTDGLIQLDSGKGREINPNIKQKRYMLIGQHERYFSKGDTRTLGYVIEDPTWEKLAASLGQ